MSSFFITGKLGSGKSLVAVGRMLQYLARGNLVCTNMDLYPERYYHHSSKKTVMRIPDKPTVQDFEAIGIANSGYDEEKNGLLVLDELGSWFNARAWQDKERKAVLDWFLYLRKRGWDVLLLVQDISMVDGQLISMLAEHLVICRRLDRVPIPYIGKILKKFGLKGNLPKMHRAKVHYGENAQALHIDTWTYFGTEFYKAYDTKQIFMPPSDEKFNGVSIPHFGVHSVLSAWHQVGRYAPPAESFFVLARRFVQSIVEPPRPVVVLRPKLALVDRIARLPDYAQRVAFYRRFESCGAFDRIAA